MTNGFELKEAQRALSLRISTLESEFNESQYAFPGDDDRRSPTEIAEELAEAETKLVRLQVAQKRYNLAVQVKLGKTGVTMPLSEAIAAVGGAGRVEKMWRLSASNTGRSRYQDQSQEKDPTKVYSKRQVTVKQALDEANKAARFAGNLRAAIAVGNATELDLGLDASLFE